MIVYKYVDLSTLESILKNHTLKFSLASDFNDPFDCYPYLLEFRVTVGYVLDHLRKGILALNEEESNLPLTDLVNHVQKKYYNFDNPDVMSLLNDILYKWRISCFSRTKDHILMWSHYSNKHKGACIGYDIQSLSKTLNITNILEIKYLEDFIKFDICKDESAGIRYAFSTKSVEWKYEEEIRLITTPKHTKMDENGIAPISQRSISEIYLGCNFDRNIEEFVSECMSMGYGHVSFKKMIKSSEGFRLEAINI